MLNLGLVILVTLQVQTIYDQQAATPREQARTFEYLFIVEEMF